MKIRAGLTSVEDVLRQVYVKMDDYEATPLLPTTEETPALPAPA
jgi:hypothetical protein